MRIALSVVFNYKYTEPAIVTMAQICRQKSITQNYELVLLYLPNEDEGINLLVEDVANLFRQNPLHKNVKFERWKLNVPEFNRLHFDGSIIAKTLVPNAREDFDYSINIDAGFLVGRRFLELFEWIKIFLGPQNKQWIIGGFTWDDAYKRFPPALRPLLHHSTYLSGSLLLFNNSLYRGLRVADVLLDTFSKLKDQLLYAEQEVLSLCFGKDTIFDIPNKYMKTYQLGFSSVDAQLMDATDMADGGIYKYSGSLKPWKHWVLDKNKEHWLNISNEILSESKLQDSPILNEMRHFVDNDFYRRSILENYSRAICSRLF